VLFSIASMKLIVHVATLVVRSQRRACALRFAMLSLSMNLIELLSSAPIRAHLVFSGFACGRWGLAPSQSGRLGFHLVLAGECWAQSAELSKPVLMRAGGLMIFQPSAQYALTDSANQTAPLAPTHIVPLGNQPKGRHVGLLCGYYDAGSANAGLLSVLPGIHLWPDRRACTPLMSIVLEAIARCANTESAIDGMVLRRLCEALLMTIMQAEAVLTKERAGMLRAEQHPALRRVLSAVHGRPAASWTVQSLARVARLSRSSFAELFRHESGQTPLAYLRHYRLAVAARHLAAPGADLQRIAHRVGYRSVVAFKRQLAKSSAGQ
jgi:AraC-like DNA-binding protein